MKKKKKKCNKSEKTIPNIGKCLLVERWKGHVRLECSAQNWTHGQDSGTGQAQGLTPPVDSVMAPVTEKRKVDLCLEPANAHSHPCFATLSTCSWHELSSNFGGFPEDKNTLVDLKKKKKTKESKHNLHKYNISQKLAKLEERSKRTIKQSIRNKMSVVNLYLSVTTG